MLVMTLTLKLYAPFCHSLKEKRMIVQSITSRVRNKFNVSITEVDEHDTHQTIILGVAYVSVSKSHADSVMNEVLRLVETSTEAEVIDFFFEER